MSDLFQNHAAKSGLVECLGQTFPSDEARREHYLKLLAEKLKDPEFRKIEGFPIGSDEAILALSDPPYYTACPNPFIKDFVNQVGKPYSSSTLDVREPFVADVSEGKNDPIYRAHPYHTKVPHKAVMRYLLHYTKPGDIVFDGFGGTGMTGVAAKLCGNPSAVRELGYKVTSDGSILDERGSPVSLIGERFAILNDLSPAAAFIASNYNSNIDPVTFRKDAEEFLKSFQSDCSWLFKTLHQPTDRQVDEGVALIKQGGKPNLDKAGSCGTINFSVWSDVFHCPECASEIVYYNQAISPETGKVLDSFACPSCGTELSKRELDRAWVSYSDPVLGVSKKIAKQQMVLLSYSYAGKRYEKTPDLADLALNDLLLIRQPEHAIPVVELHQGDKTGEPLRVGMTHLHHFYTPRNLAALAAAFSLAHKNELFLALTGSAISVSKMYRWTPNYEGGGPMSGTLYIPAILRDISVIDAVSRFLKKLTELHSTMQSNRRVMSCISTSSATAISALIPENTIDYIFIDPPFGSNLIYSDLNFLWEGWLNVRTETTKEAIQSNSQEKGIDEYRSLMSASFNEAYRLLKPGRWMTVEFSNTKAAVWNAIQTALQEAGFVVANVSALDKKQGTFKSINTKTAVKQDLVISAYKPNGGLEDRFSQSGGSEESVWDFVRTHLHYLPSVKVKAGVLEFIAERDPRIIFDRMVAWFVRHSVPVPMSSQEFQAGLVQRFVERDGMVFLSDQVAEYDKKRMQVAVAPQMEMFVSDERSAIDWLSDFLKRRPSTYQEVSPEFMGQLGAGWKKHEAKPELSALLEDNFLKYDGTGEVPSQIHSYLSTNHKDLRGLEKNSPALVAKAKDRWYVPDPNKAQDLEKKREKALLKEFETYKAFTGRKIKESRLEVLRAGFRAAWAAKDYQTIISIANKLPEETLQEDEKLLTLYDLALTRTEDGI